tara:strand:- start:579 stop:1061 length:483 start_codon:yes stop_codon:yes gene_type:complete
VLFYGPGGGETVDWQRFQLELYVDQAERLGVPESAIQESLVLNVGRYGRFNFDGLTQAYAQRQVKRRVKAYSLILAIQYGIPFVGRQVLNLPRFAAAKGVTRVTATDVGVMAIFRLSQRKLATRTLTRFIPYVGWGLAAWDIYTVIFRGELWGVQIYEKA